MTYCVIVYIDDILVFTKTDDQKEHDKLVLEVLQHLQDTDLFIKPEKCFFSVKEVDFLGIIVSDAGIKMDPAKVKGILEWLASTNVKGVHSFLGLANFYRRFIKDYAQVA